MKGKAQYNKLGQAFISKTPFYASGILGEKQREMIKSGKVTGGYLPNEIDIAKQSKANSA